MKKLLISFSILLSALALLGLLRIKIFPPAPVSKNIKRIESPPDAFMTGAHFQYFDDTGNLTKELFTPKLQQYNHDKKMRASRPHFVIYPTQNAENNRTTQTPYHIYAQHGVLLDQNHLKLWGKVKIQQFDAAEKLTLSARTQTLMVYLDENYADTKNSVIIERPHQGTLQGLGMRFDWVAQSLDLFKPVRGQYDPTS